MPPWTGLVELYGPEITWAAEIACEEINERGGLLGRPLELIIEDDGSLPATAVPAARRLIEEHHCCAIIGNLLSNSRIAVATQVAEPLHIPYLNFSFYEGSIFGRYFFHFAALPNHQIDKMIPYMAQHYGPKMFFAGNNYEWPRGSIDAAKRSLALAKGEVVGEEYLSIGVQPDEFERLLDQLASSGANVFVPYFAGSDQITLLTRFTERGLKNRMAVVMGHYDEAMVSHLPVHVRVGLYSSNTYFMSVQTPENQAYIKRLSRKLGVDGIWPYGKGVLTNFGEGTYLCVHAFAKAVQQAGSTDAEALVAALEHVSLKGPQGSVTMDPLTHHAHVNTFLARCNANGTFSIIEKFGCTPPKIPDRYQDTIAAYTTRTLPLPNASQLPQTITNSDSDSLAERILGVADTTLLAANEAGSIVHVTPSVCLMFGYNRDELINQPMDQLLPPHLRTKHTQHIQKFLVSDNTERRMGSRSEIIGYRKDGSFFPLEASIAKVRNGDGWILVVTMKDISSRKILEEDQLWLATHDPQTKLPNRVLIRQRLTMALQRPDFEQGRHVAAIFVELSGLIPSAMDSGSENQRGFLKMVVERIQRELRPGDIAGRLAANRFIVVCERVESLQTLQFLSEAIRDSLQLQVNNADANNNIIISVDFILDHGLDTTADELLNPPVTADRGH
ncbi:MAG: ABC transporter substrate-binding protein [Gammaproteobacteria bacterium]|nr:ABC transporter substrate-binding protein [Gammaproteobacteria bacterium]